MKNQGQVGIIVNRPLNMKRPKWYVHIVLNSTGFVSTPGYFKTWDLASGVAVTLAFAYRDSGYEVALDTTSCRRRKPKLRV